MGVVISRQLICCVFVAVASIWLAGTAKAAPSIALYGNLPGFEMAALSPVGDRVAIVGVVDEARRLIVTDKNNKVLLAVPVGNSKVRSITWAGENKVLLRISRTVPLGIGFTTAKAELSAMLVVPINGGKPWSIFERYSTVTGGIRGFYGVLERQGRWLGYFGGITLAGDGKTEPYLGSTNPELYEVDLENGKSRRIARRAHGDDMFRTWLLGSAGEVAATLDFSSKAGNWQIKNSDAKVITSGVSPRGDIALISLGHTLGTVIYSQQNEETGVIQWFELPLKGGVPTEILEEEGISATFIEARERRLMGYLREGDAPLAHFYDPRHDKIMAATRKAFPGVNVRLIGWNDAFDRLLVKTDGIGDPETWWLVDIRSGKADMLGVSYPMAAAQVGPMKMFRYKATDGLDISGVLTLPPGREPKNLPVVVLPHGGPASRDYPQFDWWAQALAARGYAVFQPNFRGSTGYGTAFEQAGHGQWGRKMQTDISDGLGELGRQGIVDTTRACIMGASYGGYAALTGVTLQKGLYRCAVSVAGISDVQQMYLSEVRGSGNDQTLVRSLKQEVGSGRDLKAISPIRFAERADAPILLIHGKDDTVVLYEQSSAMERALRRAGKAVELLTLPGEDHWLSNGVTRLSMLAAATAFIERHNPPDKPVR
ncbi:MAG: S9 family peptidase [Sphingobium sp.]|uniref:alpha/beta hydrolase family protein n=1 Tax=Sphingobium sp. TaxID=1912891 RepID=UPI0029BE8A7B|nr:S9 family peptidase [Sphingobium sp.]MDX3911388.1 S9 family peptidase [Sphingobium sp.]